VIFVFVDETINGKVGTAATYAAAAASLVNPHFQALLAAMGNHNEDE